MPEREAVATPLGQAGASDLARGSLRWYWNRITTMGSLEIPHRVLSAVGSVAEQTRTRFGMPIAVPTPRLRSAAPDSWLASAQAIPDVDRAPYLQEADAVVDGLVERIDGRVIDLGPTIDWRSARPVGLAAEQPDDVRHEMELHRHGHLVRLAQAWRLTGDLKYAGALERQLDQWLVQCPYPHGVAWSSALDAGLRLLNWSIAWQLLDAHRAPPVSDALRVRWVASVYVHARFIRQNLSRFSSANNHLAGELLGLVVARATWPLWPEIVAWGRMASRELSVEGQRQTHADGVNREQASWYQGFLFELLAVLICVERSQQRDVDQGLLRRMRAMAEFVASMRDCGGHLSHHGDADHATVLSLGVGIENPYSRMLSLAVAVGVAPHLAPLVDQRSSVCAWLMTSTPMRGVRARGSADRRGLVRRKLPRAFPEGGYYLLGQHFGEFDEVLVTVDAGPLGYLGIAAHGHADALSLRLSVRGHPILVDRGTYVYNTEPAWRRYFRGTLAHNTVTVDGSDQSVYGGAFLWLRKARCRVEGFESADARGYVSAVHDGYRRLSDPVTHRRRVEWDASRQEVMVVDSVTGRERHDLSIAWHFAPGCEVSIVGDAVRVHCDTVCLTLKMDPDVDASGAWQLYVGDPQSTLGWHSPHFGERVPAPTLLWRARCTGSARYVTRLLIEPQRGST